MYDAVIIGAGVTGCAVARYLARYEVNACVLERGDDVCTGTSKANSAIVHAGYDAVNGSLMAKYNANSAKMAAAKKAYMAGLMEKKGSAPIYPDANFTMRLTYGNVGGYSPKDAVEYKYYTTLEGVMQKEDPNNPEFVVPARLKELYKNKDYGRYALPNGELPTCFLTNNDITGGNSGSDVLNAKGELIGLAFDGNWEAMSGDVIFEKDLQRCINVDIRYVLFIIDKFGGAGYLLNEMTIK